MTLAEQLNQDIKTANPVVLELLSAKGKQIYFPECGILAQTKQARGKKINATIGIAKEDDNSPMRLDAIADKVMLKPQQVFPYASSFGEQTLRETWQNLLRKKNPLLANKRISMPVITNALTHALNICGYLFIEPNTPIIVADPYWENYPLIFEHGYGARLDPFAAFVNQQYNSQSLRAKLLASGDQKIFLCNCPNNPTGYTPTCQEMQEIREVIREAADKGKKILVILDDAYFGLVYEQGIYRQSLFAELADLHDNVLAVKIDGATKENYAWGLRIGFISYGNKSLSKQAYTALENKTAGAIRGNISSACKLSQSLLLSALQSSDYLRQQQQKYSILYSRYQTVVQVLRDHKEYGRYFSALPFNSGYFMCVRLHDFEGEPVRQLLLEKYDTGVIAMGKLIRIAFSSLQRDSIPQLFANLFNACRDMAGDLDN